MIALESYRGKEFIGVEELARAAASLVERFNQEPARGNVRLTITPRIVRHYLSEELLGDPTGQAGTSLVFNYGNLLRLLAVKKLLAEHWSVIKIKEFMSAFDITALEQLVNGALTSHAKSENISRKKAAVAQGREHPLGSRAQRQPSEHSPAKIAPVSPSTTLAMSTPTLASLAVESARRAEQRSSVEWIEIATGLEVKVRRSFRPPRTEHERERLAARFWSVIKSRDDRD